MENKQTAVEWLEKKLIESGVNLLSEEIEFIQQAKEMEEQQKKQQIIDSYERGWDMGALDIDCNSEKYYSETYKK
jgi:hypothetical protein